MISIKSLDFKKSSPVAIYNSAAQVSDTPLMESVRTLEAIDHVRTNPLLCTRIKEEGVR